MHVFLITLLWQSNQSWKIRDVQTDTLGWRQPYVPPSSPVVKSNACSAGRSKPRPMNVDFVPKSKGMIHEPVRFLYSENFTKLAVTFSCNLAGRQTNWRNGKQYLVGCDWARYWRQMAEMATHVVQHRESSPVFEPCWTESRSKHVCRHDCGPP